MMALNNDLIIFIRIYPLLAMYFKHTRHINVCQIHICSLSIFIAYFYVLQANLSQKKEPEGSCEEGIMLTVASVLLGLA